MPQRTQQETPMQSIMSLWKEKITWAEELNVKYFNKGSSHKIQASTCGFDSSVLGKEERMKSCGNFPSFTCWLYKKPAWVHTGTEHYYSLLLEHVFRGSPGPMQAFCQPQSCSVTILPTTWACWLLGLAGIGRTPVRLKCPQFPLQKIGQLPWCPPSFPKLPHWDLPENIGPRKLVKGHNQATINSSLKQAEELSWCKRVGTDKRCGPVT